MPSCIIFGGGVTRTFLDNDHDTTSDSSHTFTGLNFGTESSGRVLIACVQTNATSISGVTIGGVTADEFANLAGGAAIFGAFVPTGTSGSVVISATGTGTRWGVQLYQLDGMSTLAASDTDTSTAGDPTDTISVPAGGVAIGCALEIAGDSTTCTWSGVTGDATDTDALTVYSSGSIEIPAGDAALVITANFNLTPSSSYGAFASFGP